MVLALISNIRAPSDRMISRPNEAAGVACGIMISEASLTTDLRLPVKDSIFQGILM